MTREQIERLEEIMQEVLNGKYKARYTQKVKGSFVWNKTNLAEYAGTSRTSIMRYFKTQGISDKIIDMPSKPMQATLSLEAKQEAKPSDKAQKEWEQTISSKINRLKKDIDIALENTRGVDIEIFNQKTALMNAQKEANNANQKANIGISICVALFIFCSYLAIKAL